MLKFLRRDKQKFIRFAMLGVGGITVLYAAFPLPWERHRARTRIFLLFRIRSTAAATSPTVIRKTPIDVYDLDGQPGHVLADSHHPGLSQHCAGLHYGIFTPPSASSAGPVGSRPDVSTYGLGGGLTLLPLFDPVTSGGTFGRDGDMLDPQMPGGRITIRRTALISGRTNTIFPLGFSYDYYITRTEYDQSVSEHLRHLLLLKAVVVEDEDVSNWEGVLQHLDLDGVSYTEAAYYARLPGPPGCVLQLFSRDNGGFTAQLPPTRSALCGLQRPWESGWSAEVNGQPAEGEKVNVGFMAVRVPAGASTIRFNYRHRAWRWARWQPV